MKYLIELQYTTSSGDFGYEYIDTMSIECDDITQFFEEAIKEIPEYSYNITVVDIKPRQFFIDYPTLNYQVLTDIFDEISGNMNLIKKQTQLNDIMQNNIKIEEMRLNDNYYQKQLESMKIKHAEGINFVDVVRTNVNNFIKEQMGV